MCIAGYSIKFGFNIKHTGQCYRFRNLAFGWILAFVASLFPRRLHKCGSTVAAFSQKQAKVINMRILDTEMIRARAMALQFSQRNYDTKNMMLCELALQPASLFHGCGAKTKTKTKLFSRVIWKSNLHRDMHYWMDVMYCGSCHGMWLKMCWTSSATSEMWNRRCRFIHVSVDSFLANWDQWHILLLTWVPQQCCPWQIHCRWKTLKLRTNIGWNFLRPYLLTSISQWSTFLMNVTC